MAEWIGRTLDGRYAIESILGQGGMGVVLRAHHKFTGAQVAVKMLHEELHLDPQLETRFLAEARASNQIGHPAIVQVLDAGRTPEGELYLVMELLGGQSMREALRRRLPTSEVRRIARELLDALAAAHSRGFVHRDLKPENVFLAATPQAPQGASVKLLDFGIAKGVKSATMAPMTQAGVLLGTLAYMAPEQLQDASTVDPRADLWAVGVMIYEMLAGRLPYPATTIEEMFVMLARNQPDPISKWIPTVAPAIEQFFARALARDPKARFGSAAEMAAAVAQLPLDPLAPAPQTQAQGRPPLEVMTMATGFAQTPRPQIPRTPITGPHPYVQRDPTGPHPRVPGRGRNVAIVAGVAVVVSIALAVLIATQKHSAQVAPIVTSDPVVASRVLASATLPVDAESVVVDAEVVKTVPKHPRDAGVVIHDAATIHDAAAVPLDPYANDCAATCSFLGTCGLRSQNCVAECARTNGYKGCVASANGDCDKFAACFLAPGCGPVGRGIASCSDTLDCQLHCTANDKMCACRCAAAAANGNLSEWLAYNTCITGCAGDKACATRLCTGAYNRCKAR